MSSPECDKVQVYFCRHAESRHNAYGDDTMDVDLTERGEAQARALRGTFDLVLCSPMRRTRRTLELSGIRYSRRELMPELREWVNSNSDRMRGDSPDLLETRRQVLVRCYAVRERLKKELRSCADDKFRVLLVSHGMFGRLLFDLCGATFPDDYVKNATIYPLAFQPQRM